MRLHTRRHRCRKEKDIFKKKRTYFQIATQNNAKTINHIESKTDIELQKRNLICGEKYDTLNYTISECRKFTQKKYKTRTDWVGENVPRRNLQLKFHNDIEWYMNKRESILKNETYKISGILRSKWIDKSRPETQTLFYLARRKN